MTLEIEPGKFYRRADGKKAGPACNDGSSVLAWNVPNDAGREHWYNDNGESSAGSKFDLIAEWTDKTTEPDEPVSYKPYLAPFKPDQRLALEPIANGGWLVSAASPFYGQEAERLGAFGSAGDMLSALHDALTVRKGGAE